MSYNITIITSKGVEIMKKISIYVLSLVFLFSMTSVVSATSYPNGSFGEEVVIYEAQVITDIDVLFDRAVNRVSDTADNFGKNLTMGITSNSSDSVDEVVKYYSTAQKVREVRRGNEVVETFNTTSFGVLSAGNKYQEKDDATYGVRAYSTISYDKVTSGIISSYKLLTVSGGWTVFDSQLKLSDRKVTYGASGNSLNGGPYTTQASGNLFPTSNSFSYNAPTSWYYIEDASKIFGMNSWVTIKRGTSSVWEVWLQNNL